MDADAKAPELDAFLKRFPTEKFKDIETETSSMYLGKIFQAVVYQLIIKKNDYSFLYKYLHDVPHLYLLTFYMAHGTSAVEHESENPGTGVTFC